MKVPLLLKAMLDLIPVLLLSERQEATLLRQVYSKIYPRIPPPLHFI